MSSIIMDRDTFHGISVFGRGVCTNEDGETYAGQIRDGYACGLGVTTDPNGSKEYSEHGPDGKYCGQNLDRRADGTSSYFLYDERGNPKAFAVVLSNGRCMYNCEDCAPDDPRVLALTA
jgi:hypothetical protein